MDHVNNVSHYSITGEYCLFKHNRKKREREKKGINVSCILILV